MGLFDEGAPQTLEDVLGRQADTAGMGIDNAYVKKKRQAVGMEAHAGRLGSGSANYTLGDLEANHLTDLGNVYGGLGEALGQIPTEDALGTKDFDRKRQLAEYIASLYEPSVLSEVFQGIGAAGNIASKGAAIMGG